MAKPTYNEIAESVQRHPTSSKVFAPLVSGKNADGTTWGMQPQAAEWSITTTATNAAATVTRAAESGKRHYITGISGSFGAAQIALMTLSDGGTTVGNYHVHNQRDVEFGGAPVQMGVNAAAALSLGAGAASVVGAATLRGFTI